MITHHEEKIYSLRTIGSPQADDPPNRLTPNFASIMAVAEQGGIAIEGAERKSIWK